MAEDTKGITVKKADDMAEWYGQAVIKAEVADYAPIRGFMVIRPLGYSLWQSIQDFLNNLIQKMGVRNAYFPLLIPESFFEKEAEHAEGFAPEVAWIEREASSQERYAIRPTSETIMYDSYGKWIRSWRDLPLRINQWCNVVRWEVKDTKMFLRSREFLWQEGHCVYETEKECQQETLAYLECYRKLAEELLAIPVIMGKKSKAETFPGAARSYTIEGFMPDGKALQMGTSHMLGQGFARAFGIGFQGKSGDQEIPWQNSWGISTRMIGATLMMHGDDKGIVIPPAMAERKVVIVPIFVKDEGQNAATLAAAKDIERELRSYNPFLDDREEYSVGWKFNHHELKGVPVRIEIGPRDIAERKVVFVRRDTGEKQQVRVEEVRERLRMVLDSIQSSLFTRAKQALEEATQQAANWEEFCDADAAGKLILSAHCGEVACEEEIKQVTQGVTCRCIPLRTEKPQGACVRCKRPAQYAAYFARAY